MKNPRNPFPIDYDPVAEIYDIYAVGDFDVPFFLREVAEVDGPVLELTSGTGRLSIPLIAAGTELVCVDVSAGMLSVLSRKLDARGLRAEIHRQDLCSLALERRFALAILPFHSFMEIVGEDRQRQALRRVFAALEPGGRFVCTMHNPELRRRVVDGVLRSVGSFPFGDGRLVVSGFEQGGDPVVRRSQFFEAYSAEGVLEWKRFQPMEFELVTYEGFARLAREVGFEVVDVVGDYEGKAFTAATSPAMIWRLRRPS